MPSKRNIPVIDLFAGPGGLAEGFSSVTKKGDRVFDIKLSIEKDIDAHKTLLLRSFYRQFPLGNAPEEYYDVLKEKDLKKRQLKIDELYSSYPEESAKAKAEAWRAELGDDKFPNEVVDDRIRKALKSKKDWVLIGGPPCQAFSLAGRSRVGGVDEEDHRVYLYREYLRIIANHHPAVFVMENVQGLLSAEINGERVFKWILSDLRKLGRLFPQTSSPEYKIFSLVTNDVKSDREYLIKSEEYGIPQKRHRVILLGIRNDVDIEPETLSRKDKKMSLDSVIGRLPKVRSGINRRFSASIESYSGRKKRVYEKVPDSNERWEIIVNEYLEEIKIWNGLDINHRIPNIMASDYGIGSEFVDCQDTIDSNHDLFDWYTDKKLGGVPNHQSRSHLIGDLKRYLFAAIYTNEYDSIPKLKDFKMNGEDLVPDHLSANSGKFVDRFRVQKPDEPATTITSHISKDGHYFIHYDPSQCRSLTVREAARIQTFPDNYLFCGSRTQQFHQVGNAVPPYLSYQIALIVEAIMKSI